MKWVDRDIYKLIRFAALYNNDFHLYANNFQGRTMSSVKTKYHHLQKLGLIKVPQEILKRQGKGKSLHVQLINDVQINDCHLQRQTDALFFALFFDCLQVQDIHIKNNQAEDLQIRLGDHNLSSSE
ncbi:hypothetical protein SS50377_20274 [Spironucleus salmonicida]|uniref:Myb-like DNA-binding domain-containing protein n=1 Tax=Spironucleus salmonicida TaxID=348837 RepID=A0A9P8LZN6_9EUKA|nr:hypothetical protein SS50377_20274 [Spironucleus salmonicida]